MKNLGRYISCFILMHNLSQYHSYVTLLRKIPEPGPDDLQSSPVIRDIVHGGVSSSGQWDGGWET